MKKRYQISGVRLQTKPLFFRFLIFALAASSYLLPATNCRLPIAHAAEQAQAIKISPILQELTLTPGKTSSYEITVENLLDKPMGITTSIQAFTPNGELDDLLFSQIPKDHPIISWTTISNPNLILGPKETKSVTLFITPPANTSPGGYYEAVFLTPLLSNKPDSNYPVVQTKLASLLFTTIGTVNFTELTSALSLKKVSLPWIIQDNSPELSFSITNSYHSHIFAQPLVTITPFLGEKKQIKLIAKRVLANTTRTWKQTLPYLSKHIGVYQVSLSVSYGNGQTLQTNRLVIVFPYQLLLALIVIPGALLLLLKGKKRMTKAIYALTGKEK